MCDGLCVNGATICVGQISNNTPRYRYTSTQELLSSHMCCRVSEVSPDLSISLDHILRVTVLAVEI